MMTFAGGGRRYGVALAAALFAALLWQPARAGSQPEIAWRVENPFRFFDDPADTEMHRATYADLSDEERRSPILSAERALARRHNDGWAATVVGKTCWDAKHNRNICPGGGVYIYPASHVIIAEMRGIEDASSVECTWLTAPRGKAGPRGKAVTKLCSEPLRLDVLYPGGMGLSVEVGGQEVARTNLKVVDLLIVGMGDSFGSGEGNPDIPVRFSRERTADYGDAKKDASLSGYPARVGAWSQIGDAKFIEENARWIDQACHRSLYSHQLRAALQLAIEDPHRAVTFVGAACSGAEVTTGLFLRYKGNEWVPNPPEYSQISAIAEAQCGAHEARVQDLPEAYHINGRIPDLQGGLVLRKCEPEQSRKIDLVLLSIGGNDVGFARLVANAILSDQSTLKTLGGWFGHVHGAAEAAPQLAQLDDRYKSLNRAVHNILHVPWNETDRVILTAYPGLAILDDGKTVCPDGRAGLDVVSEFALSARKAKESSDVAEKLNTIMKSSAKAHGWTFADAHRRAFLGRGICAGYNDNALSSADDLRLPRKVAGGDWQPYNPADYQPYAPRQRWFRTPNDAFLTGNFHVSASLMQKVLKLQSLSWFQLLLASTYSGAFHPTAEGHAAIADSVADKARAVLAKYGQASPQGVAGLPPIIPVRE
jgi:lysophospholipase L1-like esterase